MQAPSLQTPSRPHSNFLSLNPRRISRSPLAPFSPTGAYSPSSPLNFRPIQLLNPTKMDRPNSISALAVVDLDTDDDFDRFADVGNKLADAAGDVIRRYFRKSFDILDKEDLSPVTIVDREAEEAMVKIIQEDLPSHGIYGEENGWRCKKDFADFVWVLDPIDGTKSFITGKPVFGTLIALLHKGKPILGIIDQPVLRERWIGISGRKSTLNGQEVSVRNCSQISKAYLYTTSPHLFSEDAEVAFARVRSKVKVPLYGCDCYAYALLASGFVDLVIESGLKPYDFLALIPVIEGAGGVITDWKGSQLRWEASSTSHATSFNVVAAGDKGVHLEAINALQW